MDNLNYDVVDVHRMKLALIISHASNCRRRQIGCVIYDEDGYVLSSGFNGTPNAIQSCSDSPCPGAFVKAGTGNSETLCHSIHAEVRALMSVSKLTTLQKIHSVYSTKAPCRACVIALLETSCIKIFFSTPSNETANKELWESVGKEWIHINIGE